jgi:alpha-N-arabinofuranosidase
MSEWVEYITFDGTSPMAELRKKNGSEKPWNLKYFGVGNESWGCGGTTMPHYYADEYRRYHVFVRDYDSNKRIYKIGCGPNAFDFEWTDEVMHYAGNKMQGISLHYYTIPTGDWGKKGKSTVYSDDEYYSTIVRAYKMEELVRRHTEVMNRHDPHMHCDLIVDEWGTWYDVEEGTNPGFLYQQSTMRDALVAGLTLNIFNKHSDRIRMANIAQTVNVLQSVILTDGEKMLLTPTYHIFKMYKSHSENTLLGSFITTDYLDDKQTPVLTESASVKEDGTIVSTVSNVSLTNCEEIKCQIADFKVSSVTAEILTGNVRDYNSFDNANNVTTKEFTDFTLTDDGFIANVPPCSVVKFIIK